MPTRRGPRRLLAAFLGTAVAVIGLGTYLTASGQPEASAAVVAGNLPVNRGATDPDDLSANNSPTLVVNPTRATTLAVVNRVDSPAYSCALHLSYDGGSTWAEKAIPFPAGEEAPPRCFAPDAAFGPDGTLYITFVTLAGAGNVPNAAWIVSSADGRAAFTEPVRITGPRAFQVRLLVDPRSPGRLNVSWLQAADVAIFAFPATGNPIVSTVSSDGGATWSEPVRVSPPSRARVVAPVPAFGDGTLYVAYLDVGDDRLDYAGAHGGEGGEPYDGTWSVVVARSTDGRRWEEAVVDAGVVPAERFIAFLPPTPSVAFDAGRKRLYVAFQDARSGDADVSLWISGDGGRTFGGPTKVNDDGRAGTAQYLPKLAVAPDGRLDVLYFDRRADLANKRNEVSLQSSFDGGRSFRHRLRVSDGSFDTRIGYGQDRGLPDLGSRLGLVSTDHRALAVWTDTRSARPILAEQDLARAVVAFSPASSLRGLLRGVGAALLAVGLLVSLLALVLPARRASTRLRTPVDNAVDEQIM
ncbi:MAG: sialidase family protein [Acidimicrobiales bacterium]